MAQRTRPNKPHHTDPSPQPATPSPQPAVPSNEVTGSGCLLRLAWMLVGPAVLAICAVKIAQNPRVAISYADAIFWAVAIAMAFLKRVDIVKMNGRTADDRPASPEHWKKYLWVLLAVCIAAWAGAHGAAWYSS